MEDFGKYIELNAEMRAWELEHPEARLQDPTPLIWAMQADELLGPCIGPKTTLKEFMEISFEHVGANHDSHLTRYVIIDAASSGIAALREVFVRARYRDHIRIDGTPDEPQLPPAAVPGPGAGFGGRDLETARHRYIAAKMHRKSTSTYLLVELGKVRTAMFAKVSDALLLYAQSGPHFAESARLKNSDIAGWRKMSRDELFGLCYRA